jgi:hypothetical protein
MTRLRALAVFAVASLAAAACGSTTESGFGDDGTGDGGLNEGGGGDFTDGAGGGGDGSTTCAAANVATQKAKVDIIFVIDDSGSMTEEMAQIKTNVNTFAQAIGTSGLDYQVLFIVKRAASSGQAGNVICVPPPLGGPNCGDNGTLFHHINQDVQSNNSLSLILSTYASTTAALAWNKYLRPEAWKVFVEVTDDQSSLSATSFDTQLLAKAPAGMFGTAQARRYIFHSICGWQDGTAPLSTTQCSTAVNTGSEYQKLSQLTGGIIDSVCKTDYSGVLNNMAKGIVAKLACELTLPSSATSDPTKVVVQHTPSTGAPQKLDQVTDATKCAAFPNGWYYDNNAAPTRILLCAGICDASAKDTGSKIEALVGCKGAAPK